MAWYSISMDNLSSQMFHSECPWPSAQAEISKMAAYRSPREKLQSVLRCISTIMNLLSLTCVPAADDLVPVLVYVLIMVILHYCTRNWNKMVFGVAERPERITHSWTTVQDYGSWVGEMNFWELGLRDEFVPYNPGLCYFKTCWQSKGICW